MLLELRDVQTIKTEIALNDMLKRYEILLLFLFDKLTAQKFISCQISLAFKQLNKYSLRTFRFLFFATLICAVQFSLIISKKKKSETCHNLFYFFSF